MFRFRDKVAENWLRMKAASLIGGLATRWRGGAQATIADGLESGTNPREVGLGLAGRINPQTGKREGGSVFLDEVEKDTVVRFESCLIAPQEAYFSFDLRDKRYDRSMRRAVREGLSLPSEKIEMLVNRFEAKLLKQKADLIAQTEMLAALNESEWLSTKEALEKSDLPEAALTRIWDSCGDDKVRLSHQALEGQRVEGLNESFVSPLTGAKMMYPGDRSLGAPEDEVKGCRCRVRYHVRFGYGLK